MVQCDSVGEIFFMLWCMVVGVGIVGEVKFDYLWLVFLGMCCWQDIEYYGLCIWFIDFDIGSILYFLCSWL